MDKSFTEARLAPAEAAAPAAQGARELLRGALLDSRQRWRDLVAIAADIAFETDAEGRFTFLFPEQPLGWQAARLISQPAESLLLEPSETLSFNPFQARMAMRRRSCWLRRADGAAVCLSFAVAPLLDAAGAIIGARGIGIDTTEQNRYDTAAAMALHRAEVLDHILWHIRREVLAPRMMEKALDALLHAVGAAGVMVLDSTGRQPGPVQHEVGQASDAIVPTALELLRRGVADAPGQAGGDTLEARSPGGHAVLAFPGTTRFGERTGLVLWRAPAARAWEAEDRLIAEAATGIIRMILEHDGLQREMALQARTDPLTGLLNRRAFLDEVNRRLDRLERDGQPGTLMFIDLDHFKQLNDQMGHDIGDEALCAASALLSRTVRPADLVARLGGDEFAVWLDGADELTAAERAEQICLGSRKELANLGVEGGADGAKLTMSIGIACRWPGGDDDLDALMRRADLAMYDVKRGGRGTWRVSRVEQGGAR